MADWVPPEAQSVQQPSQTSSWVPPEAQTVASSNSETDPNAAYASGSSDPRMQYHWQDEHGNELFGAKVPKGAKQVVDPYIQKGAEGFVKDNPDNGIGIPVQFQGFSGQQGENAAAVIGRTWPEIGRSAKQFALWLKQGGNNIQTASGSPQIGPELAAYNKQIQQQNQLDAPLMNSPGGRIGGTMMDLAEGSIVPGGVARGAEQVGIPLLRRALTTPGIVKQAITQGGLDLATHPADMAPGDTSYLMDKAGSAGKTTFGSLMGGILGSSGKIIQPFAPNLTTKGAQDLRTLAKNGIGTNALDVAQLTGNETANKVKSLISDPKFKAESDAAITQAILTRYAGLNEPETQRALTERGFWAKKGDQPFSAIGASDDVLGAAEEGAENVRNELFANNPVHMTTTFDSQLRDLETFIDQKSTGGHDPDQIKSIIQRLRRSAQSNNPRVENINAITNPGDVYAEGTHAPGTNEAFPKYEPNSGIPGKIDPVTFQSMYDRVSNLYNGDWAQEGGRLKDIMNSAFVASMNNPSDFIKFNQVQQRLANLHRLGDAVDDNDMITLTNLKKAMDKKSLRQLTTFGKGKPESKELWDLAESGNRVMAQPKSGGSLSAHIVGNLATGVGIGGAEGFATGDWKRGVTIGAASLGSNWAGRHMIYGPWSRAYANMVKNPMVGQGVKALGRIGTAAGANYAQIPPMLNPEEEQ